MNHTNACVVGLGNVGAGYDMPPRPLLGNSHAGAIRLSPNVTLAGGADRDPMRGERFSEFWGPPAFDHCEDLFRHVSPDLVCVAVPPASQASVCRAAIRAGVKAVICEKPFIMDMKEARDIVKRCKEKNIVLVVNHWMRWSRKWRKVKTFLDAGRLGTIQHVRYIYSKGVFNSGTHAFDILRYLFGEAMGVKADAAERLAGGEKNIGGRLFFDNGVRVDLVTLNYQHHFTTECDIIGSKGRSVVHDAGLNYWISEPTGCPGGANRLTPAPFPLPVEEKEPPFVKMIREAIGASETGKGPVRCTGCDGIKAVIIAEALVKSSGLGGEKIDPGGEHRCPKH